MEIEQLLTISAAARLVGMKPENFLYYVKKNRVPGIHSLGNNKKMVDGEVLKNWKPEDKRFRNKGRPPKNPPTENV